MDILAIISSILSIIAALVSIFKANEIKKITKNVAFRINDNHINTTGNSRGIVVDHHEHEH